MAGPIRSNPVAGSSRQQPEYKVQPPRPPNAWILYRSDKLRDLPPSKERRAQADVSRLISDLWKNETAATKLKYERMADEKKAEHQRMYPSYRFQPMKKEDKERLREERKQEREQARQAKKSKGRVTIATPAPASVPMMPPFAYAPPPYLMPPGCPPHMAMPHPYMIPYPPEARFGPAGPSPPLSAASSPNASASPEPQSLSEQNATPSSSSSLRPSPTPESQISSSSAQPSPANRLYPPQAQSLPGSQLPSPNPYALEALPSLLLQPSAPTPWTFPPTPAQVPSAPTIILPAAQSEWNDTSTQLPILDAQNPEFLNFDIPFDHAQDFAEFQQAVPHSGMPFDGFQGLLSVTGENGVFSLSNINPSDLLAHPQGELEVAVGPQATVYDFNGDLFSDFDFSAFEQPAESTPASDPNGSSLASASVAEELASLIQVPNNPEIQAYAAAQQRQPSIFTQDVMQFLNLEAAEGSVQDNSIPPTPTTVAPQQVRPPPAEHAPAIPIFTQMTNTPVSPTGATSPYAPPAGAIYSSTRRVGGSWKLTFVPDSHSEEPFPPWTIPTI